MVYPYNVLLPNGKNQWAIQDLKRQGRTLNMYFKEKWKTTVWKGYLLYSGKGKTMERIKRTATARLGTEGTMNKQSTEDGWAQWTILHKTVPVHTCH